MSDNIEQAIQDSIQDLPGNDSEPVTDGDPQLEAQTDEGVDNEPPATPAEEVDELAQELGLKPGQKDNRIPYSRVQKIIAKRQEAHEAALRELNERLERLSPYESEDFQRVLSNLRVIEEDPERFLQALAQADPRYGQLLGPLFAPPQIEPDALLPDGTLGYSAQTVQRLLDQRVAEIERRVAERFGPIEQEFRKAQMVRGAYSRVQAQLRDAQTWPGFVENKDAIYDVFSRTPGMTLEQAYRAVVVPKLAASRDEIRKQVLAELNQKPRASSGVAPGRAARPNAQPAGAPRDTEDIIREAIAGLEAT